MQKLKQQAEAVSHKIEAEKALMSKKPELPKDSKIDIKALMEYSDKQVEKQTKSMDTKSKESGDFSIETSKLVEPEQVKQAPVEAPKPEPKAPETPKKEEPKPAEKKEQTTGDFSIVTDRLVAPDQVPSAPVAVAQKPADAPKDAKKPAEEKKSEQKNATSVAQNTTQAAQTVDLDKAKLEKEVVANQKAKESTLDGGIEIETSSLDFDSTPSAGPIKVGLAQYANVDEFGLV